MNWQPLLPKGQSAPVAPYSLGTKTSSGLIASAGFVAIDEAGKTIGVGDAAEQTRAILKSIDAVLREGGGTMGDVFQVQIFIKDFSDYAAVNAVYKEFFSDPYPARYCIRADLVKPEWLVEIAVMAQVKP